MNYKTLLELCENFDFKGVSFVGIKSYCSDTSSNSEVADLLINVGASYENMKSADLETLRGANPKDLVTENFGLALIEQAIAEKIQSIVSPNENRSNGQKDAYTFLNPKGTLKLCKETKSVLIMGTVVKKNVIVEGVYKTVNSKPLTLAKKHIDKILNLKIAKIRHYKISNIIQNVRVNGDTIEIG
jgi:hypothetical protein